MYTYQMVGLADQNNRTYISKYGSYSKEDGFVLTNYGINNDVEDLIYELFHEDCWSLKTKPKKMTKEEIEKELGYEIEIQENKNEEIKSKENLCNIHKKYDFYKDNDLFSFLFR